MAPESPLDIQFNTNQLLDDGKGLIKYEIASVHDHSSYIYFLIFFKFLD